MLISDDSYMSDDDFEENTKLMMVLAPLLQLHSSHAVKLQTIDDSTQVILF